MKKKGLGILLTFIILLSLTIPALASTSTIITRLAGADRYSTAIEIAKAGWTQSDYAVLAYGENFPDALSAGVLAKKYNAPILLTSSNDLPAVTKQALTDLHAKNVFIIGGTGVISTSIETKLQEMGIITMRIAGYDRYDTAIKIAQQLNMPSELIVTTGEDYPDALSIAPIAALKQIPIILVPKDNLPDSVKNYIATLSVTKTYVIGGSSVIDDSVFNQFTNPERIVGADKYERNIAINQRFGNDFDPNSICLATGEGFADALTGALYAAKEKAPIILVNNSSSSANTKGYYQNRYADASKVYVFGGTAVVSDTVVQNLSDNSSIINPVEDATGLSKLYTEDGIGEYLGFKKLMGYTDSDKFAVYFKGTFSSYRVSVADLRGLNDNEIVTWNYNGRTVTNTRKECNNFFSDLSSFKSKFNLSDDLISSEGLHSTFGQVYLDWASFYGFSADAGRMVNKYLEADEGITDNVTLKPGTEFMSDDWANISSEYFYKWLVREEGLARLGITGGIKSDEPGYVYVYAFPYIPYYLNEMTDEFMAAKNATGVFNGIHVKKQDGNLWFNKNDLKEKGIGNGSGSGIIIKP
ncbi:cell wall-binding repeat-containing protein [Desulfosporosinus fructosivorans]|uniref:Cell wall-binding repeat-containing protein n=1 Tax=Desulfosporosinus fructosivorans TaxID=2018669 RepID=A0A4Z0QWM3_9FIRM|nr:cell wall-binding repeat-containing protein [Desulfosporosinus fructosivorans]TGE34709.1 cell wall-binding repeat-containing protein [Desulfosporosinus fructosivorans]